MLENQNIGMFEIFNATNISSEVLNFVEKLSDVTIWWKLINGFFKNQEFDELEAPVFKKLTFK